MALTNDHCVTPSSVSHSSVSVETMRARARSPELSEASSASKCSRSASLKISLMGACHGFTLSHGLDTGAGDGESVFDRELFEVGGGLFPVPALEELECGPQGHA